MTVVILIQLKFIDYLRKDFFLAKPLAGDSMTFREKVYLAIYVQINLYADDAGSVVALLKELDQAYD